MSVNQLIYGKLNTASILPLILCFLLSFGLTLGFDFSAKRNRSALMFERNVNKTVKIKSLQSTENTAYKKFISENHDQNVSLVREGKLFAVELDKAVSLISDMQVKNDICGIKDSMADIYAMAENSETIEKQIRKFSAHYMPMTLKLLNMYIDTNRKKMRTAETENLKAETGAMIGDVNTAFRKLNRELFEQASIDSESHIEAFKSVLENDGLLSKNEMDMRKK